MQDSVLLLLTYVAPYTFFFLLSFLAKAKGANRLILADGLSASPLLLFFHVAGILLFGLLPFWLFSQKFYLLSSGNSVPAAGFVSVLLVGVMLFLSPRMATKAYALMPVTHRPAKATTFFLVAYFFLRILFITSYEWWFRGLLLSDTTTFLSTPLAICINLVLYTLLHIPNGKKEMLGCLPFGLLLCVLCLWQQAVWPAIALHLALTLPYEFTLLKKIKNTNRQHEDLSHRRIRLHRA